MRTEQNLNAYMDLDVVAFYTSFEELTPAETFMFEKYVRKGDEILDIGVGGGRTTPYLAARASRYVGIDYSTPMVEACRRKFPSIEFHCEDASDLRRFANHSFDTVVFSFNGIDYMNDEARGRCLLEVKRVLRPGGHFIFSSHNAKWITNKPNWAGNKIITADSEANQVISRSFRIIGKIASRAADLFSKATEVARVRAFRNGVGYILDPAHGGLRTFVSTPPVIKREAERAGFNLAMSIPCTYPKRVSLYFSSWYYYALSCP